MTHPEQDHPDRLAEITRRLLSNLELFVDDHQDPGTEALCAIWEARQILGGGGGRIPRETQDAITTGLAGFVEDEDLPAVAASVWDALIKGATPLLRLESGGRLGDIARRYNDAVYITRGDTYWLLTEVERLRVALAECSKLADYWSRQADDDAHDYDRFIVSGNEETRMQGRRVQGKAESYTEAARALRVALAAKAGAE